MNLSRTPAFLNWSLRVGRLFGIPISLHITILFFLLPAFASRSFGLGFALEWVLGIVLSILLHELGHALVARRYGLSGLSIVLHGFGGFAISRGPRSPRQALTIALAGPAVTFLVGATALLLGWAGMERAAGEAAFMQFALLHSLGRLNILLGFLNLIPTLPWDGGQALQAALSHRMAAIKAARATAHVGLALCPALFLYGWIARIDYFGLFTIVGFLTSLSLLLSTGGVRFGEFLADRRHREEMEAIKRRERARAEAQQDEVTARRKEREQRDRLRDLFERSGIDDG